MGFGIAVDVTLATLSQYRDKQLSFWRWTLPIMCTHIMFPAAGYFAFWALSQKYPALYPLLGLGGGILIGLFAYEVICESAGIEPKIAISGSLSRLAGFSEEDTRLLIRVLAVSWDALWSGPGKESQAEHWATNEVVFSFLVAGLTVAIIAQMALFLAKRMRDMDFQDKRSLTQFSLRGKYAELSVICGFGVMAFIQGLASIESFSWISNVLHLNNIYASIGIAGLILLPIFKRLQFRLVLNGHRESAEAVAG
jgi:hypothetical protein